MSNNLRDPESIRDEIQAYYGQVAENNQEDCCDAGEAADACCGSPLYGSDDLAQVPATAVNSSRGCGNPNAIARLETGEVVLDLGCGGGLDVLLAARQVGPQGFVYGVDMTDKMLALARRNAEKMGVTNVEFRKGDLESLPLPDASVDVIISNCVVNLTPDKGRALGEAYRVLKPGGRLAISDIVVEGDLSGLPVSEEQIRAGLSWAGCIAGALTNSQFRAFLAEVGFEAIQIDVEHRYSTDDFLGDLPAELSQLPKSVLDNLVRRFTSSAISARRPLAP